MSMNITGVRTLGGSLTISREALILCLDRHKRVLPEENFLDRICKRHFTVGACPGESFEITDLAWRGEGSGSSFSVLLEKILPLTKGSMDVVFEWEGGSWPEGCRITDGRVERKRVKYVLD